MVGKVGAIYYLLIQEQIKIEIHAMCNEYCQFNYWV